MKRMGFTLIELLIVVAIIAILAAIAVPNFLEAQTRSKVSRAFADLRSLATALEAYRVDGSHYPPDQSAHLFHEGGLPFPALFLARITTPVAYITSIPGDPFPGDRAGIITSDLLRVNYLYHAEHFKMVQDILNPRVPKSGKSFVWTLISYGPDRGTQRGEFFVYGDAVTGVDIYADGVDVQRYDTTNGTISLGDVVRVGP
jgi:type II secretion system protein G